MCRHRDAMQSSRSRITQEIPLSFKHAAVPRPDGPAPTITTVGASWSWSMAVESLISAISLLMLLLDAAARLMAVELVPMVK